MGDATQNRQVVRIDGGKIRALREEKGLTQLYVASFVGVTTDTISRWENKKYPTIKKENAQRLAEALEVSLESILEREDEPAEASPQVGGHGQDLKPSRKKLEFFSPTMLIILTVAIVLTTLFAISWFFSTGIEGPVTANRILPKYVPPGVAFPVAIRLDSNGKETSVILKEDLPRQCTLVDYAPRASAITRMKNMVQWIVSVPENGLDFVYILKPKETLQPGKRLRFNGSLTWRSRKKSTLAIQGDNVVVIGPYHWADLDSNGKIDDQEILEAFDSYGQIHGLSGALNELESLWAKGSYIWDPVTKKFVPKKEATK